MGCDEVSKDFKYSLKASRITRKLRGKRDQTKFQYSEDQSWGSSSFVVSSCFAFQ